MVDYNQEMHRVIYDIQQLTRNIGYSTVEVNGIRTLVKVVPAISTDPNRTYEIHLDNSIDVWSLVWMNYTGFRVSYMESESLTYILNALNVLNSQVV